MKIYVHNESQVEINIAINHWGSDGKTNFFHIHKGKVESWSRSDKRGFIMVITRDNDSKENGTYLAILI